MEKSEKLGAETNLDASNEVLCRYASHLRDSIAEIDAWSREENIKVRYVSGLMVTRKNPETQRLEVLLVKGGGKDFWQFPGGHVHPREDHIAALYREIKQELGVSILPDLYYVKTYVPELKTDEPKPDSVLAIHAFALPGDSDWDLKKGNIKLGSDVDRVDWTDDPLREADGNPRVLTEQTDYLLRQVMGYDGPLNKNTNPNYTQYYGRPRREK